MQLLSNIPKKQPKELFDSGHLKVLQIDDYHVVNESDMVVCIPYLIASSQIIMRYEDVPPYSYINNNSEQCLVVMSETFEPEETPEQCLKRGLLEEYGIVLDENFMPEIKDPLFVCKGNTARYFVCILPLMQYDYDMVKPTTDGSVKEKKAKNVFVPLNKIDSLDISDLITKYALELFKKDYSHI